MSSLKSQFATFHHSAGGDAYVKGYEGIDWGESAPVAEEEHSGWAGYRLRRVQTAPPGGARQEDGVSVTSSPVEPTDLFLVKRWTPTERYKSEHERIFGKPELPKGYLGPVVGRARTHD